MEFALFVALVSNAAALYVVAQARKPRRGFATPPADGGVSMSVCLDSVESAPLAGLSAVEAGEAGTPSSNHGVKSRQVGGVPANARGEVSGVWDYLTLTVSRGALASHDEWRNVLARCSGTDEDHETARVLPPAILDWLLPGHALKADAFEKRGWQGYKQRADVYAPGIASPVGLIARDGNADTVCVSITGAGMFAVNLPRARLALEHYGARLTRVDAAYDDLDGDVRPMSEWRYDAAIGMFDGRGSKGAARSYVDDLGTGTGCSLYVGRKGDKQLNIYEKGKQNGDAASPHTRYETRLWAKNRYLPLDMIEAGPLAVLVGAYPLLGAYLPTVAPTRARTMRQQVEANADAMCDWLQTAAGKSLHMLREAAHVAGATDSEVLDLLTREGMPARFGGVPDEVAIYRTAGFLQGVIK